MNHTIDEQGLLAFWDEHQIYQKSKEKNKNGKKYYFMDGPPYATGHIHMGTALNKILKDIAMRAKRLQGHNVFDRPGYDTHGVPIEFQIEKEIKSKNKKDIEKYGVDKFVSRCKAFATQYIDVMNKEFANLGVWMDWDNPYLTLSDEYIEAIWSVFKKADEKKLLSLGKYPVHVCPRCETAVAYNEIEYGKQKDTSIFVKFKANEKENTYFIIWTTTPWTLPSNTGIMVHPDVTYQEVETAEGERWIIAKDLVPDLMVRLERGFTIKEEYLGKTLEGQTYTSPLSKHLRLDLDNAYRVVLSSRYVTTEEGTGLVHTAPGHGKEDYEVGKENGLPAICPVATDGTLTEEAGKYEGKRAREVDREIIEDLRAEDALLYELAFEHDYPLCWRDKTPLLMVSLPQWFLKISDIQKKILKENETVNWVPEYMKLRMKAWLEGIGDWPVSRQRYWGTPLPIWQHEETGDTIVVGSVAELKELSGEDAPDLHKPGIDSVVIRKDGKEYKRVPEVLDVWFDSGVSSWAALGYPQNKTLLDQFWPADLNIEGKDQFRGWWNSQIILSEIMFDKKPFEAIAVHGMVLDVSKTKMSKSQGNIVAPREVIEQYSRDYLRYYFAKLSRGEDFAYDEKEFREIGTFFRVLTNTNTFINQLGTADATNTIEDQWILSRLHSTIQSVTESYEKQRFYEVTQKLERFLINDVSRTYIQMIRDRSDTVFAILHEIRLAVLRLLAPIAPFTTETIWQQLRDKTLVDEESIHLSTWPEVDEIKINTELERNMNLTLKAIEAGLRERDTQKIGLRWPLPSAQVTVENMTADQTELDSLAKIIEKQLNVKQVTIEQKDGAQPTIALNTEMTPELEAEGYAREISRRVQAERKKQGLRKEDRIQLQLSVDGILEKQLTPMKNLIADRTGSDSVTFNERNESMTMFSVREKEIGFSF